MKAISVIRKAFNFLYKTKHVRLKLIFHIFEAACNLFISGRVDRASATETVDSGSILGRVKPKTVKIGIHSFPV